MSGRNKVKISLSPPEVTYFNEIKYSIGKDPLVRVSPLQDLGDGQFQIILNVKGLKKAKALATLIVPEKAFGQIHIRVKVVSGGKIINPIARTLTAKEISGLYRAAFRTNRFFHFVALRSIFGNVCVYPIFKLRIVQFFNDDLSDFYSNYNNVAAFVFKNILHQEINGIPIQFSTDKKKKR